MASGLPKKNQLLDYLSHQAEPTHARDIARALGVDAKHTGAVVRILDDLSHEGLVIAIPGDRYKLSKRTPKGLPKREREPETPRPSERAAKVSERPAHSRPPVRRDDELEGMLTVNARGFGFVAMSDKSHGADVYVPKEALGGTMHGYKVRVTIVARSHRGC